MGLFLCLLLTQVGQGDKDHLPSVIKFECKFGDFTALRLQACCSYLLITGNTELLMKTTALTKCFRDSLIPTSPTLTLLHCPILMISAMRLAR